MEILSKEELLKIAQLSGLNIAPQEVELFTEQVEKVLSFVQELQAIQINQTSPATPTVNILREDTAKKQVFSAEELSNHTLENYFVVPKILDEK